LLDLYLAPRVQRKKLNIDPESLLPSLPAPETLKPFPIFEFLRLSSVPGKSGRNRIRAVSTSPDGVWIVSGDEGGYVRIWETTVGREAAMYKFTGRIGSIAWCPSEDVSFFVVGV
jgi:ribosome biogenesis protein ERB1